MKFFDFIHYAPIKIEFGVLTLVTDYWYISNAFARKTYHSTGLMTLSVDEIKRIIRVTNHLLKHLCLHLTTLKQKFSMLSRNF